MLNLNNSHSNVSQILEYKQQQQKSRKSTLNLGFSVLNYHFLAERNFTILTTNVSDSLFLLLFATSYQHA